VWQKAGLILLLTLNVLKPSFPHALLSAGPILTRLPHSEWHSQVKRLQAALEACPDDLDVATEFWDAISGEHGYDVRDGKKAIDTFQACALKSDDGLAKLVAAFRKLADDFGEFPRASLFDPPLENLLRSIARQTKHELSDDAVWILGFLDTDPETSNSAAT